MKNITTVINIFQHHKHPQTVSKTYLIRLKHLIPHNMTKSILTTSISIKYNLLQSWIPPSIDHQTVSGNEGKVYKL